MTLTHQPVCIVSGRLLRFRRLVQCGGVIAAMAVQACTSPAPRGVVAPSPLRTLAPGLVLDADAGVVRVEGIVSLNEGWLEQVACLQGTRDHEVLVTTHVQPSAVHAALLLLGARSGAPGSWSWSDGELSLSPPTGAPIDVLVTVGDAQAVPIAMWMRGEGGRTFPERPWRFAGSNFIAAGASGDRGTKASEHYEADTSGSLIGIVTFGDEVLAWSEVLPHRLEVQDVLWEAAGDRMPPVGTAVTLVLRPQPDP